MKWDISLHPISCHFISQLTADLADCAENALAERMNGILKGEYGLGARLESKAQARRAVDQAVEKYNERRPHTALQLRTPSEAHRRTKPERKSMNEGNDTQGGK